MNSNINRELEFDSRQRLKYFCNMYIGFIFGFISNTKKYHVFAPMGRFQLELIYLYFPPSSHLVYVCFKDRNIHILDGTTVEKKGK